MPNVHTTSRMIVDCGSQDSLVAAMMDPAFYPKPSDEVTHKETHISHLFFAGDLVYKLKKPIRYSFLDYSTLAKRRHYLQEEFRLNRRLAPSVYLGVMPAYGLRIHAADPTRDVASGGRIGTSS